MPPVSFDALSAGSGGCHAVAGCTAHSCFQVQLEAIIDGRLVGHWANACAAHIGELVRDLRAWARDNGLADGTVTALAIDPAAEFRLATGDSPGPLWPGFAFSALPLAHACER